MDSPIAMPTDPLPFQVHHNLLPVVQILQRNLVGDSGILSRRAILTESSSPSMSVVMSSSSSAEHGGEDVLW